jgi:alpha-tubulin suppressor-like RCC1 family protein
MGELGDGSRATRPQPTKVAGGLTFTAITVGLDHSCGLVADGTVYCWGSDDFGEIGDGNQTDAFIQPTKAGGPASKYTKLFAGANRTCGISREGDAYCWGGNTSGQLGNGNDSLRVVPTKVVGGLQWESLSLGSGHTCGLTRTGQAYCWGLNSFGQLGDGTIVTKMVPTKVSGTRAYKAISAGGFRTCAVTATGETDCWGQKLGSKLGESPATAGSTAPARVETLTLKAPTD